MEMALVTPLLMVLMFGAFELGNYFYSEHVVVKAVRDGARYAGRLSFSNYSCDTGASAGTFSGSVADVARVTRTGSLDPDAEPRLGYWTPTYDTPETAVTVSVRCSPLASYQGIYRGMPGDVPSVKVTARVKYRALFESLGFGSTNIYMQAESESAVMGL